MSNEIDPSTGDIKLLKPYPQWVCHDCGTEHQIHESPSVSGTSTFHQGTCDVCGANVAVTEPRDYGYPPFPGHIKGPQPPFFSF